MKPQASTETGDTRQRHELEDSFIRQLWKQSENGKTCKLSFKALFRLGFVVSKKGDELYSAVKDSVDAAGIYVEELDYSACEDSLSSGSEGGNEQNKNFMPIEVKARVTVNISSQERAFFGNGSALKHTDRRCLRYPHRRHRNPRGNPSASPSDMPSWSFAPTVLPYAPPSEFPSATPSELPSKSPSVVLRVSLQDFHISPAHLLRPPVTLRLTFRQSTFMLANVEVSHSVSPTQYQSSSSSEKPSKKRVRKVNRLWVFDILHSYPICCTICA
jgi:hypothetical protein